MKVTVEYKGQRKSKLTISSQGQVRIKIAEKDRSIEKDIIEFARSEKERLGDVDYTLRKNIRTEDGKILKFK